jgi:hypothetical protein
MNMLLKAYHRLLADISELSGIHLDAPLDLALSWVLIEGPKLDKLVLTFTEKTHQWGFNVIQLKDDCVLHSPEFSFLTEKQKLRLTDLLAIRGQIMEDTPEWLLPLWFSFINTDDGVVLKWLRQCLVFCYKAEYEPTNEQQEAAEKQFLETEEAVGFWNSHFSASVPDVMFRTARQILSRVIYKTDWANIIPSHGPGAVYPSRIPSEKSNFACSYRPISEFYDITYYWGMTGMFHSAMLSYMNNGTVLEEKDDIVCNLISVPKDSRGPRLICVHPAEAIWIQQGQRRLLEKAIAHDPVVSKSIVLDDQTVNGQKALLASIDRRYTTIDLKEASDRLGTSLIEFLLGNSYDIVSCARATHVNVNSVVHRLEKWAPMGNCLTFPIQSLVFYSLVRAGIRCLYGIDCTDIYVFGDDIVVPSQFYDGAMRGLIPAGLIPNVTKTFRHGFFRESCGVDAYHGINVTPHRLKKWRINDYSDAVSLCTLAKNMRVQGYKHCPSFLYSLVSKRFGTLHLSSNFDTQGIFEWVETVSEVFLYEPSLRFNKRLQRWEVRTLLVTATNESRSSYDWYHVQDSLLRLARMGLEYSDRGTEYPVPYRERLTYGWTPIPLG